MTGPVSIRGDRMSAAVYTTLGDGKYKAHNEDAVAIRYRPGDKAKDQPEVMAISAIDQAGGHEGDPEQGTVSGIAAEWFARAVERVELGEDPIESLRWALSEAHREIYELNMKLGTDLLCTFAGAIAVSKPWLNEEVDVYVATMGDARVAAYDSAGGFKWATTLHNVGAEMMASRPQDNQDKLSPGVFSGITRAVGGSDPTPHTPNIQSYRLKRGDWLMVYTDGLGDARQRERHPNGVWHADALVRETLGEKFIARATSPSAVVQATYNYALEQMEKGACNSDNIGIGAMQIHP